MVGDPGDEGHKQQPDNDSTLHTMTVRQLNSNGIQQVLVCSKGERCATGVDHNIRVICIGVDHFTTCSGLLAAHDMMALVKGQPNVALCRALLDKPKM